MENVSAEDLVKQIKKEYPRYEGTTRNAKEMAQTLAEITN